MINYYVDTGPGFIFIQNTPFLWVLASLILGSAIFIFKLFFRFFRWFLLICFIALLIAGGFMMHKPVTAKKVVILGIDAMDPGITEELIRQGKLPNLSRLKETGTYSRIKTTIPAESVVAWTSFATGLNPGGHGIFDFVMQDADSHSLYLSLSEVIYDGGKTKARIRRKGDTFWRILSRHNVPCSIYFCPNTFPPDKVYGQMFSGMGVPDIAGLQGESSFYTTKPENATDAFRKERVIFVESGDDLIKTRIFGPRVKTGSSTVQSEIPLKIIRNRGEKIVSLEFQGKKIILREGSWSGWQELSFNAGLFKKINGIARFYLKSVFPELQLYLSPINFDPRRPPLVISYPPGYSRKLAEEISFYHTLGMPHDTQALNEGWLDEKAFLEQADTILDERRQILQLALHNFKGGILFFYFDTLDAIQHMFWRYSDSQSPGYEEDSAYNGTISLYYEKIDTIIGEVLKNLDANTILIVLSDHGFNAFRRSVHLNRWLMDNGYLYLQAGATEGKEFFEGVDWRRTKAYALGFGGIYLNKAAAEYNGTTAKILQKEIMAKIRQLRDPQTDRPVVNSVYAREDVFSGPYMDIAPDVFVGFNTGYRASWQTALGGVPHTVVEDNQKKWSGDHLIDPVLVPGVVFVNAKTDLKDPSLIDIAPTVLRLFNVIPPEEMKGKVLLKDND